MLRKVERASLVILCRVVQGPSLGPWNRRGLSSPVGAQSTEPNPWSDSVYASLLCQCGNRKALSEGRRIHARIRAAGLSANAFLANRLMQMYGKCGSVADAEDVFSNLDKRDMFSWNFMLEAYAWNRREATALQLFRRMWAEGVKPNKFTFLAVLHASASLRDLAHGKLIHECILATGFKPDFAVSTALLSMYGKCGSLNDARRIFDRMHVKDAVCWTAVIGAYAENGHGEEALGIFGKMGVEGVRPTIVTFLNVLNACAKLGMLEDGRAIHQQIIACGFGSDIAVRNALLNMYGKCGSLMDAQVLFEGMERRDIVSWNAIIGACAENGHGQKAFELLQRMDSEGIKPNRVTFLGVLDACAKSASLDNGRAIHKHAIAHGIHTDIAVRTALIHMYGKCGSLNDAEALFNKTREKDLILFAAMVAAYARNRQVREMLDLVEVMELDGVKPDGILLLSILNACSHAALLDTCQQYFIYMSVASGIVPSDKHYACIVDLLGRLGLLDEAEDLVLNMPTRPGPVAWTALLSACRLNGDVKRGSHVAEYVFKVEPDNISHCISLSNMYAASSRWGHMTNAKNARSKGFA